MTIRDKDAHAASTTYWDPLVAAKALKDGTCVIDIDGSHDCNGHVHQFETKPSGFAWKQHNTGQFRHLKALAAYGIDVLVVYLKDPADPRSIDACQYVDARETYAQFIARGSEVCTFEGFCEYMRAWGRFKASKQRRADAVHTPFAVEWQELP